MVDSLASILPPNLGELVLASDALTFFTSNSAWADGLGVSWDDGSRL